MAQVKLLKTVSLNGVMSNNGSIIEMSDADAKTYEGLGIAEIVKSKTTAKETEKEAPKAKEQPNEYATKEQPKTRAKK